MLFHILLETGSGAYVVHLNFIIEGHFDSSAFKRAWQKLLERHTVLRTSFVWQKVPKPLQVVRQQVTLTWDERGWSGFSEQEQESRLQEYLREEHRRGFDPAQAPLMRIGLMRLSAGRIQFIWNYSHLLLDGWSANIILGELSAYYKAFCDGRELDLPNSRPYREFIAWIQQQNKADAEAFWRKTLKGFTSPTVLGVEDLKLSASDSALEYPELSAVLEREIATELQTIARRHRITLSTFFEAAWARLIGFYGASSDVVFGVTVSGRPVSLPGVESMAGMLANTLPLRVPVGGEQQLMEWLRTIQNHQMEMGSYEYSSLVEIKSWSEVPGALPLFESFLVYENHPVATEAQEQHGNIRFISNRAFGGATYPLVLRVEPEEEFLLRIIYDRRRFSPRAIRTILKQVQQLLAAMAENPLQQVCELSLLGREERQQILYEWNRTERSYPAATLQTLLEQQAERTPGAMAVADDAERLTYAELNRQANQLAHSLRRLGIGPEVRVGICVRRSARMVTAVLAVLKAGGAYVPLSPDDPSRRLRHIVNDSQLAALLSERALGHILPETIGKIIYLDDDAALTRGDHESNPAVIAEPGNAAYVIYTSGSTGTPKGVVVEYGSLLNYLLWVKEFLLKDVDSLPAISSLGFDASLKQILGPLLTGRTVCVFADLVADPEKIFARMSGLGRMALNCVPSLWQQMLEEFTRRKEIVPRNLAQLWLGGESCTPELVEQSLKILPELKISNIYGPTEATANSVLAERVFPEDVCIGKPIANTRVYVLDANLQPLPAGIAGELFIGGSGVARGYQNHPELTAERFMPDPFSQTAGARLYRSGDRVRWRADGNLEFVGRTDHQVKIRGNRIELGEIEAALRSYPQVEQAAVVARNDGAGGKYLAAYVAPKVQTKIVVPELRSYVQQSLPKYMWPSALVVLPSLPVTSGGKLDRHALPVPERNNGARYAPRTPEEEALCEVFAEVLGLEQVSPEDNFFDLGGHSLAAMRLAGRVRSVLGKELRLAEVFNASTVAELAQRMVEADKLRPVLKPQERPAHLPLSYAQQRLWFIDQLEGSSIQYNLTEALRLSGKFDHEALQWAINTIVERHEILRTCFRHGHDGEPEQVILPELQISLAVEDLSALDDESQKNRMAERLRQEWNEKFDLAQGPLLRPRVIRLGAEEHVLLLSTHHIICDGWSGGVFNREFMALYDAFQNGQREDALQPPAIQYADFTLWQRSWLEAGTLVEQLDFWKEHLAGAPAELGLPLDRPRGPQQTFAADLCRITIPGEQLGRFKRLIHASSATLYIGLLSALAVLLERYSGQPDVVTGSPIANRQERQLEDAIGFFVNSLAMRVRVNEESSFVKLLSAVRATVLEAYKHQDVPFERLVEELAPHRTLNITPIFQVVFALQNAPEHALQLPGLKVTPLNSDELRVRHDLEIHAREHEGQLEIFWLYNRDLFDGWRMEQMVRHFAHLMEAILDAPDVPLHGLEMLDGEERQLLFEQLDATEGGLPEASVVMLFEQQVSRRPDAEAVICGEQRLTYGELNARADTVAHWLRQLNVTAETLVGVALERSAEMIVALLAILKAGGAYVPIAPEYPAARKKEMIADAGLRHVITLNASRSEYQEMVEHVIAVELTATEIHKPDLLPVSSPEMAAYVNYTSGSTGRPKGVLVTHASIVRLVCEPNYVKLDGDSRILQLAPLSFDAATFEIWGALLNGGCVVVMPAGPVSAHELGNVLAQERVNTLWLTAGLFHEVVESDVNVLSGIRQLLAGGDVLSADHVRRVVQAHPDCQVINGYGPTENTTFSCSYPVRKEDSLSFGVPIGFPIRQTRAYVLDARLQPVPLGVTGELYVAGVGLARGYLNEPAFTAERFIADPYGNSGTRMYRTGDLVRCNRDGALEFLGRADRQVKVRGFRVEPQEIEAVLSQMEGVSQCAVLAWQDNTEGKRLAAYVVPAAGITLNPENVSRGLKERLPAHMSPSDLVFLEALPLTVNGKLDRAALPKPERKSSLHSYRAPRTPVEEMLCEMFAEVLAAERISIGDNFFEAGGHSLLATRLVSRIRTTLAVDLPMRTIFEFPTVESLAAHLPQASAARIPLAPQARPERLPLSYAQQRLWFIDQLEKSSVQYHIPAALRLRGKLDHAALCGAIHAVVQRHESLRTTFIEVEGQAAQVIAPELQIEMPLSDLGGLDSRIRQQRIEAALRREREEAFDLAQGPLLRVKLLKLGEEEHVLLLTFHHIIADGWSLGIFNQEFIAFYEAFQPGAQNGQKLLEPLPVQYPDFALWQRAWLDQAEMARELEYWKRQLAGIPEQLVLPQDRPRQARQTFAAGVHSHALTSTQATALKRLAHSGNATLYMALLSALAVLLERYSGQKDIVIGSPIANRQEAQLEKLIGFFVNSLVMRVPVEEEQTFPQLLARVREVALAAYQHQDLPFERLVEELATRRSLNTPPIFQVMFALQNAPMTAQRIKGLEIEPIESKEMRVRLDVELHARESGEGLEFHWVYNSDLFEPWRIEQMAGHYERLLQLVSEQGGCPLWQIDFLNDEERRQLLLEWNQTELEITQGTLHASFERQVEKTPDAMAAICGKETISYRALNEQANQLAHYLQKLGAGPELRVGICITRNLDMLVGLLGILKSGAAYVALDPGYPAERVEFMLKDSAAPLLVTQKTLEPKLAFYQGRMVLLDSAEEISREHPENLRTSVMPENPAYVIYTSGSTGTPKGVAIRHSSAAILMEWATQVFLPEDLGCVLASTSICFDLSIFEIFVPLSCGGSVCFVDNVLHLGEKTGAAQITLINTVPSAMRELVRTHSVPPSVRTINLAGEVLPAELVHQIYETTRAQKVFNLYGPSEDTTYSTFALLRQDTTRHMVPIGSLVANTQAYVLDEWMKPVPVGVVGELHLAGGGLARGYLNRPELTAERFLPNPFSTPAGERMYRTGDLVRHLRDGKLEFLGRADHQVKLRGFRIELGEIENALAQYPGVSEAAVMVREDRPGDKRLVAYIVPASGQTVDVNTVRHYLQQTLPDFMVPTAMVLLAAFPQTANGKLDRKALPAPDAQTEKRKHEPPHTKLEQTIAQAWKEVLEIENVSVHDNFFDIGGHSILAKLLQAKLYTALGEEIELVYLFQFPTIASLARFLEGQHLSAEESRGETQRAAQQKQAVEKLRRARGI